MSEVVEKIQRAGIRTLRNLVQQSLMDVERQVVDQIGDFKGLSDNRDEILASFVANMNFYFDDLLDKETVRPEVVYDFENLSLVQEEEFDVILILEGLVNASRDKHGKDFTKYHTRLSNVLPRKRIDESNNPLDAQQVSSAFQEALRPLKMDAQNTLTVYRSFESCVLDHLGEVFTEADEILRESGVVASPIVEKPKRPEPKPAATTASQSHDWDNSFNTVSEVVEDLDINLELEVENSTHAAESTNTFSMMQNLMHGDSPAAPAPGDAAPAAPGGTTAPISSASQGGVFIPEGHVVVPANQAQQYPAQQYPAQQHPARQFMVPASMIPAGSASPAQAGMMQPFQPSPDQQVQLVDQTKLMEVLNNIQLSLVTQLASSTSKIPTDIEEANRLDISESLGEMLNADQEEGVISAVDGESSDVINLVTMLFEAIWADHGVPIPIKELIGRTQITVIKVALSDNSFFSREDHPLRAMLNEFAIAGISWTQVDELAEDPLYKKMHELVEKILVGYEGDISFFENLIKEFRKFIAEETAKTRHLEQTIIKKKDREDVLDEINELVTQKIDERILDRELDTFIADLLQNPFHKFMELLVLEEGPDSSAWKQAINTIDVLLWTVEPHDQSGDREKLETVNPRLIKNLRKAFKIAAVDPDIIEVLISNLEKLQRDSFPEEEKTEDIAPAEAQALALDDEPIQPFDTTSDPGTPIDVDFGHEAEEEHSPYLETIEGMTVGTWVEFVGEDGQNTRCKLAAKINAIDKFIFVNRQGVKVLEKTTFQLATELEEDYLRIISDGLLFSRALESVVSTLRENQIEQHTGGAYQPTA